MCAIIGALVWDLTTRERRENANDLLNHIVRASHERGRDGRGFLINAQGNWDAHYLDERDTQRATSEDYIPREFFKDSVEVATFLSNLRAEPTTEFVQRKSKDDQQPYLDGDWAIVHNGTIANDAELRTGMLKTKIDSAAIAETLAEECRFAAQPLQFLTSAEVADMFRNSVQRLKGSYAIIANHASQPQHLLLAVNYRPLWYVVTDFGVFFASARHYFPSNTTPRMVEPYTMMSVYGTSLGTMQVCASSLRRDQGPGKALVVCSGGLDSVVAATYAQRALGYSIELIHFLYGSRAEGPEVEAVQAVASELGVKCTLFPLKVYDKADSPLLQEDSAIAGGEAGAEFAHEWVPARNLLLLSVATAYAEAKGFDTIILGNNLEEAGAYPDNEPEFIDRFNDLLPFAVGDGKRMKVIMPVGNMMKHEIVALGHEVGAPLHLTWSCYRAGEQHCGKCGPCYMRRTAFEINELPEVINYEVN